MWQGKYNEAARRCEPYYRERTDDLFGGIVAPVFEAVTPVCFRDIAVGTLSVVAIDVSADFAHVVQLVIAQIRFVGPLDFDNSLAGFTTDGIVFAVASLPHGF